MSARPAFNQLAAARPTLLDHTERVVDGAQEDQILRQVLCSPRLASAPSGTRARPVRVRSPRLGTAVVAGVAAATLAVAGILVGTGTFRHGTASSRSAAGQVQVISARTLADRTTAAIRVASRADILYTRSLYANGTVTSTGALEEWDLGLAVREKLFDAKGSLSDDVSAVVTHGMRERRFVNYPTRTWTADSIKADRVGAPGGPRAQVDELLGVARRQSRKADGTDSITLVNVHGTQMFKVTSQNKADVGGISPLPMFTDSDEFPNATIGKPWAETVWINRATHLPVRVVLTSSDGQVLASETFAWLTPSRANLAELVPAPVPAGFRQEAPP